MSSLGTEGTENVADKIISSKIQTVIVILTWKKKKSSLNITKFD